MSCPTVIRVTTGTGPPGIGLPAGTADAGKFVRKAGSTAYAYELVTPDQVGLPQGLAASSSPIFAGLTLSGMSASVGSLLLVGANGQLTTALIGTNLAIVEGALVAAGGGGGGGGYPSLTMPTGFSVGGNTTASLVVTFATGYSLPTNTRQGLWDTAYAERLYWDGSSAGLSAVDGRASLELGSAAQSAASDFATPAALSSGLAGKADLVGNVVPTSQIPAIAISDYLGAVASQAAMLALTGQRGDWCLRTDGLPNTGQWILGGDNAALLSNWVQIPLPTVPVQSVNGQAGVIVLGTGDLAESGGNLFFTAARAIGAALTGFTAGAGTVSATDSILQAIQKIVGNIANLLPRTIETVNIAYSATINIDFAADNGKTLIVGTLTGPLTFTFSNIVQGRNVSVDLLCDSTQRALTFPGSTPFLGPKPSNIAASKAATLTFECRRAGTTDADVRAAYGVQS